MMIIAVLSKKKGEPNRSTNLLILSEPNRNEPIREPHNFYTTEPRITADNRKFKFKSNSNNNLLESKY